MHSPQFRQEVCEKCELEIVSKYSKEDVRQKRKKNMEYIINLHILKLAQVYGKKKLQNNQYLWDKDVFTVAEKHLSERVSHILQIPQSKELLEISRPIGDLLDV